MQARIAQLEFEFAMKER